MLYRGRRGPAHWYRREMHRCDSVGTRSPVFLLRWPGIDDSGRGSNDPHERDSLILFRGRIDTKGISHALKPVPKTMWEHRNWSFRSQSPSDDRYGSSGGTPKKMGCKCEKRLNARGFRDTGEALSPVSSSAIAVPTMIQLINTVHSNR